MQAVAGFVGKPKLPGQLFLPYAQLATALLESSPLYGINHEHALCLLGEPFLSLPSREERERVLRELVRGNVLMVRPFSSWVDSDETR